MAIVSTVRGLTGLVWLFPRLFALVSFWLDVVQSSAERKKYDERADLFAILKATDHLETAYRKGLCNDEYERECSLLIGQFRSTINTIGYKSEDLDR